MATNAESETPRRRITVPAIRDSKVRNGNDPLVMVTAYDAPMARIAEAAEVDMIFVRRFGTAFEDQLESVQRYANEVRQKTFPAEAETYVARDDLTEALGLYGSTNDDS